MSNSSKSVARSHKKSFGINSSTTDTFPLLIRNVYTWMSLALAITGVSAFTIANNQELNQIIAENGYISLGLLLVEFVIAMVLSARLQKMTFNTAAALFGIYALLTGITLSIIFTIYTAASIASTFFITAGTFASMSLIGYYTKKDLTKLGQYLLMALIGMIIASIVNLFMQSDTITWVTTYAGIFIFVGLTAYDTQKIKNELMANGSYGINDNVMKIALFGSFILYLDFINLFLKILKVLGKRK